MEVLIVRHAIAVEHGALAPGQPDEARPLTEEGRRRFRRVVRGLLRLDLRVDRCLHSPWTRAVETADLLRPVIDGESVCEPLLAGAPGDELIASLRGRRPALVGHEPWMSEMLALLVFGDAEAADGFGFKKGGVAWLEGEAKPGGMRLLAFMPPGVLRRL
jgi:phosphohistidine phosphatase